MPVSRRKENKKGAWIAATATAAAAGTIVAPALEASDEVPNLNASYTGCFSEFHAQGDDDWRYSETVEEFAESARHLGQNLYRHFARIEPGTLGDFRARG